MSGCDYQRLSLSRRVLCLFLSITLILSLSVFSASAAFAPPSVSAEKAIVLNAGTGEVYFEKNADTPQPAASMTKLMSLYLVFEALAEGRLNLEQAIPISPHAAEISHTWGYSGHENLAEGGVYRLEDLIILVELVSANGSMIAIAEFMGGGDESVFVQQMNARAAQWGINAQFSDSCGFNDEGNAVSPRAMAYIAQRLIQDYPQFLQYSVMEEFPFQERTFTTTNALLKEKVVPGIDGMKTGYTRGAGYCFTGTALRDDTRIISVVMNAESRESRMIDTRALLEYGFTRHTQLELCKSADRAFLTGITASSNPISPYKANTFTATFSQVDTDAVIPCEVYWRANGKLIQDAPTDVNLTNGASCSIAYQPEPSNLPLTLSATVVFPDGSRVQSSRSFFLSRMPVQLAAKLSPPRTELTTKEILRIPCVVSCRYDLSLSFPAGWYLDGEPVPEYHTDSFQVSPIHVSVITLAGWTISPGEHTLEFRCEPDRQSGIQVENPSLLISVRKAP